MAILQILLVYALQLLQNGYGSETGYLTYCPCMGRFGNQMEQFLGTLAFAKRINLTLLVSPIIHYISADPGSRLIPFQELFNVDSLRKYHEHVMTLDEFMQNNASTLWPLHRRTSFCHSSRSHYALKPSSTSSCEAKDGRPFGPFWDAFVIDFVDSAFYSPLDVFASDPIQWRQKFPIADFPVWAFVGQPGYFPALEEHLELQQYVNWSEKMYDRVDDFIHSRLQRPFLAIHLRNNVDFERACVDLIRDGPVSSPQYLFSSAQCHGYRFEHASSGLTREQCIPSRQTVLRDVLRVARAANIRSVFVATDHDPMLRELHDALQVPIVSNYADPEQLYLDVALLARADMALLNCASSFSAFAKRERDVRSLPTEFFAFTSNMQHQRNADESQPVRDEM